MDFYTTFVSNSKVGREPLEEHMQEVVSSLFDNASTAYVDVEEEIEFGTMEFQHIDARINSIIDAKTGQRVNDDFKKIIFKDINYKPKLGTRYKFSENIWIVFSTEQIHSDTSSVYIQRCNHTLNMQDKFGLVHKEPCCIGYDLVETPPFRKYSIDIPIARSNIFLQNNEYTRDININSRFLIGGDAYKVRTNNKLDLRDLYGKDSAYVISFFLDYDELNKYDNLELGIADYKEYKYHMYMDNNKTIPNSHKGTFRCVVMLNDEEIHTPLYWYSSDTSVLRVNPNTGDYFTLKTGECIVSCRMAFRQDIQTDFNITVSDELVQSTENKIEPYDVYIAQNCSRVYSVFEYINDKRTDTTYTISADGVPSAYYTLHSDGNSFKVTNIRTYDKPLLVKCVNNRDQSVEYMNIELGGLF